ncbi:MAG TPA: hypothetical protein VN226_00635 [Anaerolineales bacterium]|nr:hypothetical protein [Anaerolineales bacterium]
MEHQQTIEILQKYNLDYEGCCDAAVLVAATILRDLSSINNFDPEKTKAVIDTVNEHLRGDKQIHQQIPFLSLKS